MKLIFFIKSEKDIKRALKHKNIKGAGYKKRKKIKNPKDKFHAVLKEWKKGTLHASDGSIIKDQKRALAVAFSESGQSKKKQKMKKSSEAKMYFFKAQNLPVGTVSTLSNGQKVKKVAEGKWVPVSTSNKGTSNGGTKQIEGLQLKDGFYYDGNIKITDNPEKARQYAEKKKESGSQTNSGTPEIKVGAKVRVKSDAKVGGVRQQGRGIIATIKEVGKDFVKLANDAGQIFTVKQTALEMAKSIKLGFFNLIKGAHKYIKREGSKGKYRYWYRNENGKIVEGRTKENSPSTLKTGFAIRDIKPEDIENMKKDRALRNNFIVENQSYVNAVIKQNKSKLIDRETQQIDYESAVQNGNLGFIRAIDNFDTKKFPTKTFSHYLYQYILGYMKSPSGEQGKIQGVDKDNLIDTRFQKILNEKKDLGEGNPVENIDLVEKEYRTEEQYKEEKKNKSKAAKEFIQRIKKELQETKNKTANDRKRIKNELQVADLLLNKKMKLKEDIATTLKVSPSLVSKIIKKITSIGNKYIDEYAFKSSNEISELMEKMNRMIKNEGIIKLFFKSEISEGTKVEGEHKDTIEKIKKNPKITLKEAEKSIAKDHIREAYDKGYKYYSRLIATESLEDYTGIEGKIIEYIKSNKSIKDEDGIHEFAKHLGINTHVLEEKIYAILKKIIGDKMKKSRNIKLVFFKALPEKKEEKPKSPPKGYPEKRGQYADPKNYSYPLDSESHVRAAISYFSMPRNYKKYSSKERKSMWSRIKKAAKKYNIEISKETGD